MGWLVAMVAFGGYAAQGAPPAADPILTLRGHDSIGGATNPFGISAPAGDLDGDPQKSVDLAISTEGTTTSPADGKLVIMRNNGKGEFSPWVTKELLTAEEIAPPEGCDVSPRPGYPDRRPASTGRGLAVVDVNHDGKNDVLVADAGQPQVLPGPRNACLPGFILAFINNGNGDFTKVVTKTGARPLGMGLGHFNNDPHLDMVIDNEDVDDAQILIGDGNGNFTISQTIALDGVCDSTHFPSAADVTRPGGGPPDGKLDALVPGNNNGPICVLPGNGDGTVGATQVVDAGRANKFPDIPDNECTDTRICPRRARPHMLAVADFAGGKALDFAVANTGVAQPNPSISVFINAPPGSFREVAQSPFQAGTDENARTAFIQAADMAGRPDGSADGHPDLVATSGFNKPTAQRIVVLVNSGKSGVFKHASGSPFLVLDAGTDQFREVTVADLNGDGKTDVAVIERSGKVGVLLHN